MADRPGVDQEGLDATGDQLPARIEARGVVIATQSRLASSSSEACSGLRLIFYTTM